MHIIVVAHRCIIDSPLEAAGRRGARRGVRQGAVCTKVMRRGADIEHTHPQNKFGFFLSIIYILFVSVRREKSQPWYDECNGHHVVTRIRQTSTGHTHRR